MNHPVIKRYFTDSVATDLKDRMVFVGGPRQVGKTVFALGFLDPPEVSTSGYLNWDDAADRNKLLRSEQIGRAHV